MSGDRRITLFRNGIKGHGYLVFVPDSLEELLRIAAEKLHIEPTHFFAEQGALIDDIRLIRDNDVVYVATSGEVFSDHAERPYAEESGGIKRKLEHLDQSGPVVLGLPGGEDEPVKLFVGSLNRSSTKDDIEKVFSEFGAIVEIKMLTDKVTGASKGAAFVRYTSRSSGERAIAALNNTIVAGSTRPITVKYAEGDPNAAEAAGEWKLFVGSLPKSITQQQLQDIFAQYGAPSEIVVLRSTASQSRSGAFVKYRFKREALAAISGAHGLPIEGTPIVVRFADSKAPSSAMMGGLGMGGPPFARLSQMSINGQQALQSQNLAALSRASGHSQVCPLMHGYNVCTCGAAAAGGIGLAQPQQQQFAAPQDMWKRQMVAAPSSPQRAFQQQFAGLAQPAAAQFAGVQQPHQPFYGTDLALNQYQTYQ
eukprot:TRINITY_DN503_c0_g1_i3.p1 TRINITY_DN503_c0_g1~~TRINITY_DN503_c0_g1_i3.p1  ORF type:complete len:423 (-),score=61.69 TRINITY_DN503_c0_g1_i3:137-1405(-)